MLNELISVVEDLHGFITSFEIKDQILYIPSSQRPCSVIMIEEDGFTFKNKSKGINLYGLSQSKVKNTYCELFI